MADTQTTYNDGSSKWLKKPTMPVQSNTESLPDYNNILPMNLLSCDIKSDVVGESWKIVHSGAFVGSYEVSSISGWNVNENILTLRFGDGDYFRLLFFSIYEAQLADLRLFLIMNGHSIIGCNDATSYNDGPATITNVIFS